MRMADKRVVYSFGLAGLEAWMSNIYDRWHGIAGRKGRRGITLDARVISSPCYGQLRHFGAHLCSVSNSAR